MAKELCPENYKTLLKEIKDDVNKWKASLVHVLEDLILLKMTVLHRMLHRVNAAPIPISMFLQKLKKKNPKVHREYQKTPSSQNKSEKEE